MEVDMTTKKLKLSDLVPDQRNANKGTPRGQSMLKDSLQQLGAGRSILIDKNGAVIAGNKTLETASATGFEDEIVVETDDTKLVAVKRTDMDLVTDPRARKLAYADNRVAELDLEWNQEEIAHDMPGLGEIPGSTAEESGVPVDNTCKDTAETGETGGSGRDVTCPRCGEVLVA